LPIVLDWIAAHKPDFMCLQETKTAETERLKAAARQSDQLTDELLESDLLVMATPMWNFGIPAALKAWIGLVVRPGRTFRYSDAGVLGLAKDKEGDPGSGLRWRLYGRPMASMGFCRALLAPNPGFHRHRGCADCACRGNEYSLLAVNAVLKANKAVEELAL
jgi:FMN-dependent NADH-azoreductase